MSKLEPHPFSTLFPPISEEDFGKLAVDIKLHGLRQRIVLYQGKILDGNNRYRACEFVGIKPEFAADFPGDDAAARNYVISANIHRRHLDRETREKIVEALLKGDPTQSNRQIAATAKVDDKTVGVVREKLEATAEIPQLDATTGADGKSRKRRTRNTSASNPSDRYDKAQENLINKLQALSVEQAEGAAKETIKLLNSTVATMKARARSAKAA
jgi:ParB-like chromosome segregation protein Spo0J